MAWFSDVTSLYLLFLFFILFLLDQIQRSNVSVMFSSLDKI